MIGSRGAARWRAFSLLEAMIVLGMIGVVLTVATSTFVALMRNASRGRATLQSMQSTRVLADVILEYGRRAGGQDLPGHARVLVDKAAGQRNTDLLWLIEQASGYGTCGIVSRVADVLTLPVVSINGAEHCCFEAGAEPAGTPPLAEPVPTGPAFRRTAVIADSVGRFLPVFLEGAPSVADCTVRMKQLPGIDQLISADRGNMPVFTDATVVLADVRRFYIDFDAEGVRAPFGALFAQVEVDGDVESFVGERQRLSSNAIDLRVAVGYDAPVPEDEDDDTEIEDDDAVGDGDGDDDEDEDEPDPAPSSAPLLEMQDDMRGWRLAPLPVIEGEELSAPKMLGVAVATAARGDALGQPTLPWSTRPLTLARPANAFPLVGRVLFRDGARP